MAALDECASTGDVGNEAAVSALDEALWPRAALPRRPMLGAVLDALTVPGPGDPLPSFWCATGLPTTTVDRGNVIVVGSPYHSVRYPWIDASVTEAYELLQARGLIPMECRSRFVCEGCGGRGTIVCDRESGERDFCDVCSVADEDVTGGVRAVGHLPHPPTVAALASWASLGFAAGDDDADDAHVTIARAEDLARELNDGAEVWWQVAPRTTLAPMGVTWPPAIEALWGGGLDVLRGHTRTVLYVPPLGLVTP